MGTSRGIIIFGLIAVMGTAAFFALLKISIDRVRPMAEEAQAVSEPPRPSPYAGLDLQATAVVVWDVEREAPLFVKNAHEVLPLASLTKVMTALVALDRMPTGTSVTIRPEDLRGEGDQGLLPGERWHVADLVDFMLITSSNDGALSLAAAAFATDDADASFAHAMNEKARTLDLQSMFFLNPTGLDTTAYLSGGYGSAYDMARLFSYAIEEAPAIFEATSLEEATFFSEDGIAHRAENTNTITGRIPWLVASKTGFTDLAGGNLVIAFDGGLARPIVVVVLGSTTEGRFSDVEQLVEATFAAIGQK